MHLSTENIIGNSTRLVKMCMWRDASPGQVENILQRAGRTGQFETLVYHSAIDPKKVK